MLEDGYVKLARHEKLVGRRHGADAIPAVGLSKYAVDFDGDGRADIWNSVPDALASAAKQLVGKGWQRDLRWAYEVHPPADVDCTTGVPENTRPLGEWLKSGFVPAYGRTLSAAEQRRAGVVVAARGPLWPRLPRHQKLFRHQGIQFLRPLRAVRRASQPTAWPIRGRSKRRGARSRNCRRAISTACRKFSPRAAIYHDKIDGKAGMKTRAALGEYQKRNGLKVDCWPTAAVLAHMQAAGRN